MAVKMMLQNKILRPKLTAALLAMSVSLLLSACGSGDGDPIVAERDLPEDDAAISAKPKNPKEEGNANLRFARMALNCVNKQFPSKINHVVNSESDVRSPAQLYPAFYGCYDWHSAVQGHWLLVRLWGRGEVTELDGEIEAVLARNLTPEKIDGERTYFTGEDRDSFERPYGMVWFLQLTAELRNIEARDITAGGREKSAKAKEILQHLAPLEAVIVDELKKWLLKLNHPIRSGVDGQTAFAFGMMIDWANQGGDEGLGTLAGDKAMEYYREDKNCPIGYEPSGEDFLSPCLMEADLMRRILPADEFASWLSAFLPDIPTEGNGNWINVAVVQDPSDGALVHLDGLNLSRAWALQGIASGLPEDDPRRKSLIAAAQKHENVGLQNVMSDFYTGAHWLASFATYLTSKRGLKTDQDGGPAAQE